MNYRHAYHAGNHADVLKHVALTRLIALMQKKDKGFLFLDAHAGIGTYALDGMEALKTGEWQGGIGKLTAPFTPDVEALLSPYRKIIAAMNPAPAGHLNRYPGSPELAARLLRPQDRLVLNELHLQDFAAMARDYAGDKRVDVLREDAAAAIKLKLPPAERRGLILIDPPYEQADEAQRAVDMLAQGLRRFATGVFVLWYPVKADGLDKRVAEGVAALGIAGTLQVELRVREAFDAGGLAGSGLMIVNTPWTFDDDMKRLAPALAQRLGLGDWGRATVKWRVPPV